MRWAGGGYPCTSVHGADFQLLGHEVVPVSGWGVTVYQRQSVHERSFLVLAPAQSLVSGSAFAFADVLAWAQQNNLCYTTC